MKMKSFVVAALVAIAYAFYLGYTSENVHSVADLIVATQENVIAPLVAAVFTFAVVIMALSFKQRYYYLFAPKTVIRKGVRFSTLEAILPGSVCTMSEPESRSFEIGSVVLRLKVGRKELRVLVPESQTMGLELGGPRNRTTSSQSAGETSTFVVGYNRVEKKLVFYPRVVETKANGVEQSTKKLQSFNDYLASHPARQNAQA